MGLLPHSSPYSSINSETKRATGSGGWMEGSGNFSSMRSMIGEESCTPSSSGVTTSGTSGSFAYFLNSGMRSMRRMTHSWGICLYRKYERTFTE